MPGSSDSRRWPDRLATATGTTLGVVAVVAVLTAARLASASGVSWRELVAENEATNALLGVTFGVLGIIAVADRPRNGLSWLFVVEGQANAWTVLAALWVAYSERGQGSGPADVAILVATYAWMPGLLLAVAVLPMLFPNGHWLSPPWRWIGRAAIAFSVLGSLVALTSSVPVRGSFPGRTSPFAVFPWSHSWAPLVAILILLVGFAIANCSVCSCASAVAIRRFAPRWAGCSWP